MPETPNHASAVARLLEQTVRSAYTDGRDTDLTPGQWAVLRYLAKAGKEARATSAVADYLGVTPRAASRAIGSLVRRKLINRSSPPSDRNVVVMTLSPAGRAVLQNDPVHQLAGAINDLQLNRLHDLQVTLEILSSLIAKRPR